MYWPIVQASRPIVQASRPDVIFLANVCSIMNYEKEVVSWSVLKVDRISIAYCFIDLSTGRRI